MSVSMTQLAHPMVSNAQFRPVRPSGSLHGGCGLGVPDKILDLYGRNLAIGVATGRHISSGTPNRVIGGHIDAPTRDALICECILLSSGKNIFISYKKSEQKFGAYISTFYVHMTSFAKNRYLLFHV